tara:strand:- start:9349 stop:11778 length:2430 start_codon:yes stop_codon:yes gene_type:complete
MITLGWIALFVVVFGALFYHRVSLLLWTSATALLLVVFSFAADSCTAKIVLWIIFAIIFVPLNLRPFRKHFMARPILKMFSKVMPPMSDTEREALEAGTVWWDGELFSGKPDWDKLAAYPEAKLTPYEQEFLDGPVNELCSKIDDWDIAYVRKDLSPELWQYIKDKGFFGLVIPKQYGGIGLSPYAFARVVERLYSTGVTVATTVGVPGTLGPAELLMHYGTEEQKDYYLPRLASGQEIPCFALTGPDAGSDAGAMPDTGIVCKGMYNGEEVIGIRLNFNKRYISFAPVATLIGLAFKMFDPEHLLSDKEDLGITCALVPRETDGITIGRRHLPANNAFQNGPIQGKDVFIPVDSIIGGAKMAGHGWRMLMECLAAGRAICLPASGVAGAKVATYTTGAYARIRKQFNVSIGKFEGVEDALAEMASVTYWTEAAFKFTLGALNSGAQPPVASAIVKYHLTEANKITMNHGMDIQAGKAVIMGPNNYLALGYQGLPIGITVEGANILTRCMIIFGQGAIRCHPYVLQEMQAAQNEDRQAALESFDKAFFAHIGFIFSNAVRSFVTGFTGARWVKAPKIKNVRRFYQHVTRYSASFALAADLAMFTLGGELKRREKLSARFADILSKLYIVTAVLKRFQDDGYPKEDIAIMKWTCLDALYTVQEQFDGLLKNFPNRIVAGLLRVLIFPTGKRFSPPSDRLGHKLAKMIMEPNETRDRILTNAYCPTDVNHKLGLLEDVLKRVVATETIENVVIKAYKKGEITGFNFTERVHAAMTAGIISGEDANALLELEPLRQQIIAVDDFDIDFNFNE